MRLLPLFFAFACSDYELNKEPEPESEPEPEVTESDPSETESETETEAPEVCEDQTLPGFEGGYDETCENEVSEGTFDPITEWSHTTFSTEPSSNNVMMHPIVVSLTDDDGDGDIDDEDVPDIVFVTYPGSSWTSAGVLRAISGDGSGTLFDKTGTGIEGSGSLAAGDIDGDGYVEIIAVSASGKKVMAFEHDGTAKWTSSNLSLSGCYATAPAISDMDHDGDPEIVVGNYILTSSGTVRGTGSKGNGACVSFPADVDADGTEEVVVGNALYDPDGTALWTSTQTDGYPAVADFDGDGEAEIVVVDTSGYVRLQDNSGTVVWKTSTALGYGPPTIADFDADGEPEIGVAGRSTYTVIEPDGTTRWQNSTVDSSSGRTGSSVFDFEGDGAAEVVYADETRLWVYSGVDGSTKLESSDHTSWTWIEYATIADVDGDDEAEIIVPSGSIGGSASGAYYGIQVIGDADNSWRDARPIWNQHAYMITNVNDDGTIPTTADLNWLTYNNFRSGDLTAEEGTLAPDLTLSEGDVCELQCDDGTLYVWVHAGNEGAADLTVGATVTMYAEIGGTEYLLDEVEITDVMYAGEFQDSLQFTIEYEDPASWDAMIFRIESDDLECDSDDNELRWEGPFCVE